MTVHVSGRSISALLLVSVSLVGLPADALAQSVVASHKTAATLTPRLDRLAAELIATASICTYLIAVTMTYSDCREVGVGLASDTFTLQPSTEWGRGK